MIKLDLLFPEGRKKAVTLSYDDGVKSDIKLMKIADKYGLKCTFNINTLGHIIPDLTLDENCCRLTHNEIINVFKNSHHETAIHSLTHPYLKDIPTPCAVYEIINDKRNLERLIHNPVWGFTYPFNSYNNNILDILKLCNIKYARTTTSTYSFDLPDNWLEWSPTCLDKNEKINSLINKFTSEEPVFGSWLFYLWGHSYFYERNNNWDYFEEICKNLGKNRNIWYATNIEIYNYINAYKSLIFDVDTSFVYNPTPYTVWFEARRDWVSSNKDCFYVKPMTQIDLS